MKINSLQLKNFRRISDAEINFDCKSAIIYGINGMGKSTLLDACNILFSRILREASADSQVESKMIKKLDVKLEQEHTDIRAKIKVENQNFTYSRSRTDGKNTHNAALLKKLTNFIRENYIGSFTTEEDDEEGEGEEQTLILNDCNLPIYVFYGINRYIDHQKEKRLFQKKYTGSAGKLDAWRDNIFGGIVNFELFFDWFRSRQEYENSIRVEQPEFEDFQLKAARKAILAAMGSDFSSIKIRIQQDKADLILVKCNQQLQMEQLSEGEKSVLALTGDLARRLSIANPKSENPLLGQGIVLIDEIDLHLHPVWQAKILPVLLEIFPNIQFIVTTHAPKVLGEIGDEVSIFRLQESENNVIVQKIPPLTGWDVNTILEEYMDTNCLNLNIREKIERMQHLIHQKKYDDAEQIADELAELTDEKNTDVVRARILIAKGR